jgi:peptidoglycan-associated lipoprotein
MLSLAYRVSRMKQYIQLFTLAVFWAGLFHATDLLAQTSETPTSSKDAKKASGKSKDDPQESARKLIRQGDRHFERRELSKATGAYIKAFDKVPENFYLAYKLGRTKWYEGNADSAILFFTHAKKVDAEGSDTLYFDLASALKKSGQYDEAKMMYKEFLARHQRKDFLNRQATFEMEGCDAATELMKLKPKYQVKTTSFNSKFNDFSSALWAVEADSFLVFTSHRSGSKGKGTYSFFNEPFSDVWVVKMDNDSTFGAPEVLGKKRLNTKANDGSACIDPTGMKMYYSICGKGKINKHWGCSIYESDFNKEKKDWGKFQLTPTVNGKVKKVINSKGKIKEVPTDDKQPWLSPDGNIMYFASDRDGGQGGHDIWFSQKNGAAWTEPQNCGKNVNTEFDENWPHIAKDGNALYFASSGHKGLGGWDMWKVEGKTNAWGNVENLGFPLNTSYDDFALIWLVPDSIGFLTSDRVRIQNMDGTMGRDDIFRVKKVYSPSFPINISGRVRDKDTRQVIPFATVTLYRLDKNKVATPIDTFKTQQNGYYEFELEPEFDYKLVASADEYLTNHVFVSTFETNTKKGPVNLDQDIDIYLDGIQLDEPYVLQNIYYDFDKADLRSESIAELDKLLVLLNENPSLVIQVGSHTDTNGTERYNMRLGDRRARAVVDYLIKKGIPRDRLVAFGYGESTPMVYPELSDYDEQSNRRTEFRIRSFDYRNK